MNHTKSKSLIICLTPLQMLIAEKIIQIKKDESFDLLVIALSNNSKYRYYYNRLKKHCSNSLYYHGSTGLKGFFPLKRQLKSNHMDIKYSSLYYASIDSKFVQYIASNNKLAKFYSFDDGAANIVQNGMYYKEQPTHPIRKLAWKILGVDYNMQGLKNKSLLHYTIYKTAPNIIDNKYFISLLPKKDNIAIDPNIAIKEVKFFLGQPLQGLSSKDPTDFIMNLLRNLEVDYYFPHPRELNAKYTHHDIIKSNLIFEDYLIHFLEDNPYTNVIVYSFTSSCILNIATVDRVKAIFLYDSFLKKIYNDYYAFAKSNMGIESKSIENFFGS